MGFMPEAMLNYLGRMGWSMPDEREKFSLQEMVDNFDLNRVSLGGPIFDIEKLSWLNGQWLRELPVEEHHYRLHSGGGRAPRAEAARRHAADVRRDHRSGQLGVGDRCHGNPRSGPDPLPSAPGA
uniref:Glutamate--tRNA ligase, chloroplastic/mitochondrial n=1 Tax=Tanacetum cinerariifolium TaxID=118510 RepID=A0A699TBB2_TANCI|nr:glutamate--tRNA ligase, chloroplastic/mitochondrial [Tanacetum cinerariifolium]